MGSVLGECALANSEIQRGISYMRILLMNELTSLRRLIENDKYIFCYVDKCMFLKIIDNCSN